jgi:hypothetical protein
MKRGFIAVLAVALLASLLFILNRGFGGGHGKYDGILGVLGLPWILLPWPDFLYRYDFVWLILVPLVLNWLSIFAISKLVLRLSRK